MSRVGKKIIDVPSNAIVTFDGQTATVKGPKSESTRTPDERMTFKQDENTLEVVRPTDSKEDRTVHDTTRALLNNMVQGVSQGFVRTPEFVDVGHRTQMQGNDLVSNAGHFHLVEIKTEDGTTLAVEKNITATVSGVSKEQVGAIAPNIRLVRPPEPYKGKSIRYQGEYIRRKEGKTGK